MNRGWVAIGVSLLAACGGKAVPDEHPYVVAPMAGIGECVDPAPATTRASVYGLDDRGHVVICRDDGEECRSIDPATGAMGEHYPTITGASYDQPGAVVEDDGQLLVCWGQTSCLRRTPSAYEKWLQVGLAGDQVAVLSAEADRRWVTVMDHDLTTVTRFEVAPRATDALWRDGRFLVYATEDEVVHGYLYAADGTPRGVVGALGAGKALDIGDRPPVELSPGWWGFVAQDGSALAAHDVDRGDGVRVDLGVTGQVPGALGLGKAGEGRLAVALGGAAYGDLLIVDVEARRVDRWVAKRCEVGP